MEIPWILVDYKNGVIVDKTSEFFLTEYELFEFPKSYQNSMKYLLKHSSEKFTKEELIFFNELLDSDDISNLKMVYYLIAAKDE